MLGAVVVFRGKIDFRKEYELAWVRWWDDLQHFFVAR